MFDRFIYFFKVIKKIFKLKTTYRNHLIIIAVSGIGDTCYGLSFLNELKKLMKKKALLLTTEYTSFLGECYKSVDKTITLKPDEASAFISFFNKSKNIFIYNKMSLKTGIVNCFPLTEKTYNLLNKKTMNYIEILSSSISESKQLLPEYPCVKKEIFAEDYFENPDRTIIINPSSNSLKFNSNDIFIKIINVLKTKGYSVYTNVVGTQKPLPNTMKLNCSSKELYFLSQQTKLFISIRSGIIDFCISNGGNYLILYDNTWNGNFNKAYTLHSWKTNSRICEFNFKDTDEIIKKIEMEY